MQPEDTTQCAAQFFCLGSDLGRGNLNQTLQLSSRDAQYYTRPNKRLEQKVYKGFGEISYKMYCEAQLASPKLQSAALKTSYVNISALKHLINDSFCVLLFEVTSRRVRERGGRKLNTRKQNLPVNISVGCVSSAGGCKTLTTTTTGDKCVSTC